jgi:hypothetical protein
VCSTPRVRIANLSYFQWLVLARAHNREHAPLMPRAPRKTAAPRLGSIGIVWLGLTGGCAPSFESVHEGSLRFEHCYRLDHDPEVPANQREYCWNEWVRVYTYGQTRDRVDYAGRRLRVLRGEPLPGVSPAPATTSQLQPEAPPLAVVPTASAAPPAPSNEPPSKVDAPSNTQELPLIGCSRSCETALRDCKANCQVAPKGCAPCDPAYKDCLGRCFE